MSDDSNNLLTHMNSRFDRLETKLDSHLERISIAEADIGWLKGSAKVAITIGIAVLGFIGNILFHSLNK